MIKHTPGYRITKEGYVFSIAHNWRGYGERKLKQDLDSYGYPSVRLTIKNKRKHFKVHQLVAMRFLSPKPSCYHELRHLDGNKTNNHANNLAWGTPKENALDRERHGRTSRGVRHSKAIKRGIKNSINPYWKHARAKAENSC